MMARNCAHWGNFTEEVQGCKIGISEQFRGKTVSRRALHSPRRKTVG